MLYYFQMKRKHWVAALISFFIVGLGQIVKGEGKKGLLLLLTFYFFLPALIYFTLMINAYLFLFTLGLSIIFGIILWGYNIWDALTHETIL